MDEIYEVSRHHRVQTHVNYNQFFHPNICHVCKSTDLNNLILCDRCNMISYCSKEHRRQHRPQHEDICSLITRFIQEDPRWDTHRLYFQDWIKKQKSFVRIAEMALGRKLKTYEVQMFMFAKSCFICHQRTNLFTCEKCISIHYCIDHISEITYHTSLHDSICDDMALSLNLDILFLEEAAWKPIHAKVIGLSDDKILSNNTDIFCDQYKQNGCENSDFSTYAFTDYVSAPMTLYHGLQCANLFEKITKNVTSSFIVHIIAADHVDRRNFPAWEIFLHLLSTKSNLTIVMVGLELQLENYVHKVCSRCNVAKKKLTLQCFPLLYHNYVHNIKYRRPNVVIGFQAELSDGKLWSESLRVIQEQNCPLLLTTKSQLKAYWNMIEIEKVLGTFVKPLFHFENYFISSRPYRDFESGHVFFRNSYLIMYKDLNDLSKTDPKQVAA